MASKDKNTAASNPTARGRVNEDQNATSANAQDQTLLKALQDLIVRVMDPKQTNDINQTPLGPEAGKLITALQEFISSIVVRSQTEAQSTTIEVSADKEADLDGDRGDKSPSKDVALLKFPSSESNENPTKNSEALVAPEKPQPTFKEKLLTALREHVFNKLPIRLLCFEPHGSIFKISLLERGGIYWRIALVLQSKLHEEEFRPLKMTSKITGEVRMEPESELISRLISKYARYAILSHTWLLTTPEVTYGDWNKGLARVDTKGPGYQKIVNFCKVASEDYQLTFGWMDTVCINKESSSELDESIRSMYNWYSHAKVCIIYLAKTEVLADMHLDPWFTRGWTLQEMLAPEFIKFYSGHWKRLVDLSHNDKDDKGITKQIDLATTMSKAELKNIRKSSISRRMQLAASRKVTREEDTAYSLMGIFNVGISTAYGEGAAHAFSRLLQEILISHEDVLDVLNWAGELPSSPDYTSRILPSSPKCYTNCSPGKGLVLRRPIEPLTLSHLGLRVPVILMPGRSIRDTTRRNGAKGDYSALVNIFPIGQHAPIPTIYNLLDNRISGPDDWKLEDPRNMGATGGSGYQMTFAIFNFSGARNITSLPKNCIAIGLQCREEVGKVSNAGKFEIIRTSKPIVFQLGNAKTPDAEYWNMPTDELAKHGMQLISMYL